MGTYQGLAVASQGVRMRPAAISIIEPHENHKWRSDLAVNNFRRGHPYRRHRYVLQNVLILQAVQVTLYTMENSSPFMGYPVPIVDRHTTTAFAGRHTLRVVTLSLRTVNWKRSIICWGKCWFVSKYDSIPLAISQQTLNGIVYFHQWEAPSPQHAVPWDLLL